MDIGSLKEHGMTTNLNMPLWFPLLIRIGELELLPKFREADILSLLFFRECSLKLYFYRYAKYDGVIRKKPIINWSKFVSFSFDENKLVLLSQLCTLIMRENS